MKKILVALTLVFTQNVFSQDSIYKKNGEIIPAKVLEITDQQVKFKKTENLNGPSYTELKSKLFRIKFANGTIDTIHSKAEVIPQITQAVATQTVIQKRSIMYIQRDDELYSVIETLPNSDSKIKLKREYALMKHYKNDQYLANGLGMGIGFAVPVVTSFLVLADLSYGNGNSFVGRNGLAVIVGGALVGAAIRITGQVLTKVNKNKRMNARRNIYRIYDEMQ